METETFLLLVAVCGDCNYYLQFAQGGEEGFRAEAVSNAYLQGRWLLSPVKEQRLIDLGWNRPSNGGVQTRNFIHDWASPAPYEEIARLAITSLREVYDVERPSGLVYRRFARGGPDFAEPTLGISAERPHLPRGSGAPAHPTIDQVTPVVEAALCVFLGVEELERDPDGDIPIRAGSAILFVRMLDSIPPVVSIFSPVLNEVERSPDLLQAINEINDRVTFGRVFWHGGTVVAMTELLALRISPEQIAFACLHLGELADVLDDTLRERFGGRRMTDQPKRLLN